MEPPGQLAKDDRSESLTKRREAIEGEMASLIGELHSLEVDGAAILEANYNREFGELLHEIAACELRAARLKREIELIQASLNRGEAFDYTTIVAALDTEFSDWERKVREEHERVVRSREILDHLLTTDDAAHLRNLYRKLARALHPDLNPAQGKARQELWLQAQSAYEHRDLERLEALVIIAEQGGRAPAISSLEELAKLVASLEARLSGLLERRSALRDEWPFSEETLLGDPTRIAMRREELEKRRDTAREIAETRNAFLQQLLDKP